jgi:DNA-directed RNA polymerase subunit RPC12/RpoP
MLGLFRLLIGVKTKKTEAPAAAPAFQPATATEAFREQSNSPDTRGLTRIESQNHRGRYYYSNPMPTWLPDYPEIEGDGISFAYEVAGTSHYQEALRQIVGGRRDASIYCRVIAMLSPESDNPHDPRAIAVRIEGEKIGYIKATDTDRFHESFENFGASGDLQCKAKIVGGWEHGGGDVGSFGVRLDINFPVEIRGKGIVRPIKRDKRFSEIGRLDDVCPNCHTRLASRPGRKTKCQHCSGLIFVRARPFDRQRVLLTEAEAKIVEDEWAQFLHSKRFVPGLSSAPLKGWAVTWLSPPSAGRRSAIRHSQTLREDTKRHA